MEGYDVSYSSAAQVQTQTNMPSVRSISWCRASCGGIASQRTFCWLGRESAAGSSWQTLGSRSTPQKRGLSHALALWTTWLQRYHSDKEPYQTSHHAQVSRATGARFPTLAFGDTQRVCVQVVMCPEKSHPLENKEKALLGYTLRYQHLTLKKSIQLLIFKKSTAYEHSLFGCLLS